MKEGIQELNSPRTKYGENESPIVQGGKKEIIPIFSGWYGVTVEDEDVRNE